MQPLVCKEGALDLMEHSAAPTQANCKAILRPGGTLLPTSSRQCQHVVEEACSTGLKWQAKRVPASPRRST